MYHCNSPSDSSITVQMCISWFRKADGELRQIGPRQIWDGAKHEVDLNHLTNKRFATCSRRSLESRQGQCKTDWYARVHARCTGGMFCLWRMQSQCLSQELKKVRHVSYQAETHVSPSWKRWDTCLTNLKRWSRHWQHGNTGHNHYFEVSKPVWMVTMHSISTEKLP